VSKRAERQAATEAPASDAAAAFRDRIIGFERVKASDLKKNARNWRLHPESQRGALGAMLKKVGIVGAIVTRKLADGSLEILDGHLRQDIAGSEMVPVLITDLNDQEAAQVLATFDPIAGLAETDEKLLAELLKTVDLDDNAELRRLITDLTDQMADEEDRGDPEAKMEVPGMALEPHEHYDYLVVLASDSQSWNLICDKLGLKPMKRRGRMGTARACKAEDLIKVLK